MRGARSTKTTIDGILLDSMQEAAMYCWCKEARELGVIRSFECHRTWEMTKKAVYYEQKQLKTKVKQVERTLLHPSTYTCDFIINSNVKLAGLHSRRVLVETDQYVIDVKGAVNKAASEFSLKQKMMWYIHRCYVNKVIVAHHPHPNKKKAPLSKAKVAEGFFAMHGAPINLPREFYYKNDSSKLKEPWRSMFQCCDCDVCQNLGYSRLPLISEVYSGL